MKQNIRYDAIVIGSGMGGMTTASLLAQRGLNVLVLEAAHLPGGCSSSYKRKGYIFESGATTLIGFDKHQPLRWLEKKLHINIPKWPLDPSMAVYMDGQPINRWRNREDWIKEAGSVFGNENGQSKFWNLAFKLSDQVWELSEKNSFFPPVSSKDLLRLVNTLNLKYLKALIYNFKTVEEVARECMVDTPGFLRFLDEQLIITAQAKTTETPFLFGAPAITYTNSTNYYVPGGLLQMIQTLQRYLEEQGGSLHCKEQVTGLHRKESLYEVTTNKALYKAPVVISNIPIWNMADITTGEIKKYYNKLADKFDKAWGAVTMGLVTEDHYPGDLPLHNQLILTKGVKMPFTGANSVFVSLSHPDDTLRSKKGERVLNVSCHTNAEAWFGLNGSYEDKKEMIKSYIINVLQSKLPGFDEAAVKMVFLATPVTWQNWVYRKFGRVGGIPQQMEQSVWDWPSNQTPFSGLFACGDTVFPGQGIPGVTLSGINTYHRIIKQ